MVLDLNSSPTIDCCCMGGSTQTLCTEAASKASAEAALEWQARLQGKKLRNPKSPNPCP